MAGDNEYSSYHKYYDDDTSEAEAIMNAESAIEHKVSVILLNFAMLLAGVLVLSKALQKRPKLNAVLSESALVLLFGLSIGFFVRLIYGSLDDESAVDDDATNQKSANSRADVAKVLLSFPNEIFFLGLLPPILFNSGYELQRELFFRHFRAIVSFAVVGTIVSGFATGFILFGLEKLNWFGEDFNPSILELLTFGALIAATDTVSVLGVLKSKNVDPHLFNLVFGESALNDAVALVLFRALSKVLISDAKNGYYILHEVQVFFFEFLKICFGSPALGIVFSFIAALVFKRMDLREQKNVELCLYILLVYIPYMLAEVFHLSGIVTIFFTGMSARRYIEPNLSPETAHHAESIFKALAYLAETAIFLELGLTSFGQISGFQWKFAVLAFLASLVGRALSIYPISAFYNWSLRVAVDIIVNDDGDSSVDSNGTSCSGSTGSFRRRCYKTPKRRLDREIPNKFMHVLWFAGLRGAIAYACARSFPDVYGNKDGFVSTTMFIVLVSVVVMGGLCDSLLEFLKIRMNVDEKEYMKLWRKQRKLTGAFHDYENEYIYNKVVRETKISEDPSSHEKEQDLSPPIFADGNMLIMELSNLASQPEANADDYVLAPEK